jgi:Tfp pilus assembly protein PilF
MVYSRLARLALLATFAAGLAACTGAQKRGADYDFDGPAGDAVELWFAGDEAKAEAATADPGSSVQERFAAAEIAYWRGDAERAFDLYLDIVTTDTGHDLARLAAARAFTMRGTVLRWDTRVLDALERVDWAAASPLTRVYLSMNGETATQRVWSRSETTEPFDAMAVGFPSTWKKTPILSTWRLTDFDTTFPGEAEPLVDRYLSPVVAVDDPRNLEMTEIYASQGTAAYPSFGRSGVYLLENYITLNADSPRDFWVYGHFVAQTEVRIDGEVVMRREEGAYDSPKMMRRIRLSPGTHRVVVKMAYSRGYRDWFDLAFVPDGDRPFDDTALSEQLGCSEVRVIPNCYEGEPDASWEPLTDAAKVGEYETIWVTGDDVAKASDLALYLTMAHAYYSADDEVYEVAWETLRERRPDFAAGFGLTSDWLQTLWQVPSRLRDSRTLKALRQATELDPDSLRYLERLGGWLREKDGEREAQELLERARDLAVVDGRVRDIGPLNAWASFLSSRGWQEESENAWRAALDADPANCSAAASLMNDLHARSIYPDPAELTSEHERCRGLYAIWLSARDDEDDARLAEKRRDALRAPWDAGEATTLSRELEQQGKLEEARATLDAALKRMPDSIALWNALADFQLAHESEDAAKATLEQAIELNGRLGWLVWKLARLDGSIPLEEAMPNGLAAARAEADRTDVGAGVNDDAYFVVDFAARQYFPDLSSITLTHTVVRVMTKDAIDRYGERSLPSDAVPLLVRTIKQDGSVRVPEQVSGKDTLSMPGLAEGDFVEVAYLQYEGPNMPATALDGVRFYFRMADISTRLSEYVILGEKGNFMIENGAPKPEPVTIAGQEGVRFVARDNPRPRDEPRTVPSDEYLPWIQMYRLGTTLDEAELVRRNNRESIADSLKRSRALDLQIADWNTAALEAGRKGSRAWVEQLFYDVTAHITEPSGGFSTDVGHALLTKEGNPMMLLKATFDALEVPNDMYLVKTAYQPETEREYGEISRYNEVLMRIAVPDSDEVIWSTVDSPDGMFGVIHDTAAGRPAVCITCDDMVTTQTPSVDEIPTTEQTTTIEAQLGRDGTLAGTTTIELQGILAAGYRTALRSRPDDTTRDKLIDQIMSAIVPSSTVTEWKLLNETDRRKPLVFSIMFTRPEFARQTGPGIRTIEERLFREPLASAYAPLPDRTTPLFINSSRRSNYRLEMMLPDGVETNVLSQMGERELDSEFGKFSRSLELADGKLVMTSSVDLGVQRVPVAKYAAFQQWALAVEQSSAFLVILR